MPTRRRTLLRMSAVAACAAAPALARAAQPRSLDDPFRLAVDQALAESGLASRLQRRFGRDTGVAIRLLPGPARDLLAELERGEHDGALLNTPQAEVELERLGLLHDRRQIATVDFLIVGPTALRPGLDALAVRANVAPALSGLAHVGATFIGAPEGSGTRELESDLWRAARVAPQPSWYRTPAPGQHALAAARASLACCLIERGVWAATPSATHHKDFGVLVEGDPLLRVQVHAMRSFRVDHPAGKLFMGWLSSRAARQAIATLPAYHSVSP
ncbi:MAG: hypothetical protein ACKVOX_00010 [Rhizobacter sp.]